MTSAFRTVSLALLTGIAFSQLSAPLSAQAKPQQNTDNISKSTQTRHENRATTIATNIKGKAPEKVFPKLEICNFTQDTVNYAINGSNSALESSSCQVWRLNSIALLTFDRLFSSGYQGQTYELSEGQYIFRGHRWANGQADQKTTVDGLNLFRFQPAS